MSASRLGMAGFLSLFVFGLTAQAVQMQTVLVANPGNPGEWSGSSAGGGGPDALVGSVAYTYRMGTFEVTTGQYTEFLNAVARSDPYNLYNTSMNIAIQQHGCGIVRSGTPGSYTYSVAPDRANRPVNYVSWADAARFANWMHNGQPVGEQNLGTTEDGSYHLNGTTGVAALQGVVRKAGATWVIPTEDEWYKAAYHKNDGPTGNYYRYPTSNDAMPSNILGTPSDPGNNATFYDHYGTGNFGYTVSSPYYRTEVGAHENSASPYGTFDQGGNVWEFNEAIINTWYRGARGGAYGFWDSYLHAADRDGYFTPLYEFDAIGFRLAWVPEPSCMPLLALAMFSVLRSRHPRRFTSRTQGHLSTSGRA